MGPRAPLVRVLSDLPDNQRVGAAPTPRMGDTHLRAEVVRAVC